ncbi:MAG TPA: hypothetical protein VFR06_09490, partial [Gallionellaceae bacterium]|nr:hypothetical protein [Gallionellaceae bacterium]
RIYAVENVDQAIAILTDLPAGEADANGEYPEGSFNRRVAARLAELTGIRESFARRLREKPGTEKKRIERSK